MTSLQSKNIRPNLADDYPQIDPTALIDPSAQIIGNVKIDKDVFGGVDQIHFQEKGLISLPHLPHALLHCWTTQI